MHKLDHFPSLMTVEDVLNEAREHDFPAKPVRLVSTEINSWRSIGHAVVKTKEELEEKAIEVMEFSGTLHLMVVPSDDIRFWNPKLLYQNSNEREREFVEL